VEPYEVLKRYEILAHNEDEAKARLREFEMLGKQWLFELGIVAKKSSWPMVNAYDIPKAKEQVIFRR
jgi:hypothetical protein